MNTSFTKNTEGIFYDLPAQSYHAAAGCSHSMLKNMHPRPAHLQAYLTEKREPTPAQILGTLVHHRVLEPERPFPQLAVKAADMKYSTREGKAWREEQLRSGRLIIGEDAFNTLTGTVASIARHPVCREIFANGRSEVSVFKNFHLGGVVLRKARLDWVPAGNALVDVKTTQDASPEAFAKEILNYRYHSQAAYYLDIWNDSQERPDKECFILIAVEKSPPYLAAIYNLDPKAIGKGRQLNMDDLASYIDCAAQNRWPGYAQEILTLDLPRFAYQQRSQAA
jgi:exodeoxyribonuclease VIII